MHLSKPIKRPICMKTVPKKTPWHIEKFNVKSKSNIIKSYVMPGGRITKFHDVLNFFSWLRRHNRAGNNFANCLVKELVQIRNIRLGMIPY
jgi:hypothetical protein